jgi:hypothetical protein
MGIVVVRPDHVHRDQEKTISPMSPKDFAETLIFP